MNPRTWSRRDFVRGAGGIGIGLPFLASLAPRGARAADPKRLVVFNHPEGVIANEWQPAEGADRTGFALGPSMAAALTPFRGDLIVTRGVDSQSCKDVGSTHKSSMDHILTGGSGTSIDQTIAKKIGAGYRFASLEFGVNVRSMAPGYRAVWSGGSPIPCVNDPAAMFARMFGGGSAPVAGAGGTFTVDQNAVKQLAARRKSVIDAARAQFESLRTELAADDRGRLDAHLTAIREAEKELLGTSGPSPAAAPPPTTIDCKSPQLGAGTDLAQKTRQQMDLLVLALACRLTPVATLQWSHTGCAETFPWLGVQVSDVLHGWVHNDKGNPAYTDMWKRCLKWFSEQMAYLLGRMKQIQEGSGTLLDNSAVVMVSSFGHAGGHRPENVPFVIAGKAGGALRTGQFLDYTAGRQPHSRVLLTLARAFGVEMSSYGNPKYGTSPLAEMLA